MEYLLLGYQWKRFNSGRTLSHLNCAFIIHSVDDVLRNEFGKSLGSRGVSILDPFTGTGTFITRLLQSKLIKPEDMEYKFRHDIHANEIVLLAYYIAAINIESTYHSLMKGGYIPFKHIGLADTFRMLEKQDLMKGLLEENSEYLEHQKNWILKLSLVTLLIR